MSSAILRDLLPGLDEISGVGRDTQRGGYSRHLWQGPDLELRTWFIERAQRLDLDVETDRNGNMWAWWGAPGPNAVIAGSHLDSVPGGGAYDGPLGVVSALDAIERLQQSGFSKTRPCAIVVFAEEEGSRFGIACLGSKLMTGAIDPDFARALVDSEGSTLAESASRAGVDPAHLGSDTESLERVGLFIELHIEQGRGLIDLGHPVAVASSVLPHGRWRITINGQGNHAGATEMNGRRDPTVAAARVILEVERAARETPGARATVGRLQLVPGGTNVIASRVEAWLDARAFTEEQTEALVARLTTRIYEAAAINGCTATVVEESWAAGVVFDPQLRADFSAALGGVPELSSGAGHDAAVVSQRIPSAMLFVRNPTGISHSPEEFSTAADCIAGVDALERLLRSVL